MEKIVKNVVLDYRNYRRTIEALCERYSALVPFTIGRSVAGRDIIALRLGSTKSHSLFAAAFHGSEYITTNVLLYFIEDLCGCLCSKSTMDGINIAESLCSSGVIFVPLVNPDGVEISIRGEVACGRWANKIRLLCGGDFKHWNSNLRGVDINHNFNADWGDLRALEKSHGIFGPAPTRYGGETAESESETRALCSLCRNTNIRHAVALHSQGEVIYWDYKGYCKDRAQPMAEKMAALSGYALDVPMGLAVGGGFKDWFQKELRRPAFTVEIGKGKNPLPIDEADVIYNKIRKMMLFSATI